VSFKTPSVLYSRTVSITEVNICCNSSELYVSQYHYVCRFCFLLLNNTAIYIDDSIVAQILARYVIYTSCAYAMMSVSVCLSARLSVTEVHSGRGACREEGRGHLALC